MSKISLYVVVIIGLTSSLSAYDAICKVKYFNSNKTTKLRINVSNRVLTMNTDWGTYYSDYKGREGNDYVYYSVDKNAFSSTTNLGKIKNGRMSYYSVADDGYGFSGTCNLK